MTIEIVFQYHYGLVETICWIGRLCNSRISIPLWFSRNETGHADYAHVNEFQYHYGLVETKLKHLDFVYKNKISIPLWFSRNLPLI